MPDVYFDWATARSNLASWIQSQIGIRATDANGSQTFGGSLKLTPAVNAEAKFAIIQTAPIGHDEVVKYYDEDADLGEEITTIIRGMRAMTLEIRVESRSSNAGEDAVVYCEKIRALLHDSSAKAELRASGLGLRRIEPTRNLSSFFRDRLVSVAQIDVLLHARVQYTGSKYGIVETIIVESDLEDPSGNSYRESFQIIGEIT